MNPFWSFATVLVAIVIVAQVSGECQPPKKLASFEWHPKEAKEGGFYTPYAMRNDTNVVKEMLQGSSLNPDQDLKKLCIRLQLSEDGKDVSVLGNNNVTSHFKCNRLGEGKEWSFDCQHQHESGKEDFSHKMYVTFTDKKTFAFVVRCWNNGLKGWTVFSTRKELPEDTHFHILEHAKSQGFETAHALPISYKSCRK